MATFGDARLPDRFWSKVEIRADGCWAWGAGKAGVGYGSFYSDGGMRNAHRIAYERLVADVAPGLELDHLCRVHECVNPSHLEPVTHLENVRRGRGGSVNREKTECKRGHNLSGSNLLIEAKTGKRACLLCHRKSNTENARKRRADPVLNERVKANRRNSYHRCKTRALTDRQEAP